MISISNRSAYFHYFIDNKYSAGIVLQGTEVKSIRNGKVSFNDSFCLFINGEIWVRSLYIGEYSNGNTNNHIPTRDRKLLLTKHEIKKIQSAITHKGTTIIPLQIYFNKDQLIKMEIGLAKGKKLHDKRENIKEKDSKIEIKRTLKNYIV